MTSPLSKSRSVPSKSSFCGVRFALSVGLASLAGSTMSGCVEDPDCGICNPSSLVLETISGVNYAGQRIFDVGPECEGDACPDTLQKAKVFVTEYSRCVESDDANKEGGRGPEEWCRLSPLIVDSGIEFFFNNLLNAQSVELVRKQPDNPVLLEPYEGKTRVLRIEGPITRYNGDYLAGTGSAPDRITRLVNLSCVENLSRPADGSSAIDVNAELFQSDPAVCEDVAEYDGTYYPIKTQFVARGSDGEAVDDENPQTRTFAAQSDARGIECTTTESPDTCCAICDFELGVNVKRYGRSDISPSEFAESATPDAPELDDLVVHEEAIKCDTDGNVYEQCADFVPYVDRSFEARTFSYDWDGDGEAEEHRVPLFDRIREIHPELRGDREKGLHGCTPGGGECAAEVGLGGTQCIGIDSGSGKICDDASDDNCEFRCRAEWFVACDAKVDESGQGFCVDKRFKASSAAACYFEGGSDSASFVSGRTLTSKRLARKDSDDDGKVFEVCDDENCDPFDRVDNPDFSPLKNYDRESRMPEETRECVCGDPDADAAQGDECADAIRRFCYDEDGERITDHRYAYKFLRRLPGIIYDPAPKGIRYYPADIGGIARSRAEICAAQSNNIKGVSIQDGWVSPGRPRYGRSARETEDGFDRGLCSGSEYRVIFSESGEDQFIQDKNGNTLDGRSVYRFETAQFHVKPGSGYPTDNLVIGACDAFELEFSNKYDMSENNTKKLQIWELEDTGCGATDRNNPRCWRPATLVAGGLRCVDDQDSVDDATPNESGAVPCLTIDIQRQHVGRIRVSVDPVRFRTPFQAANDNSSGRYRLVAPGLGFDTEKGVNPGEDESDEKYMSLDAFMREGGSVAQYREAFQDICGMPLVTAGAEDFHYDFSIDPAGCADDVDGDGVGGSCDNSSKVANPSQSDFDRDGFGDVTDLCAVTAFSNNRDDSDLDGVGGPCDSCPQKPNKYNKTTAEGLDVIGMWVRSNPSQADTDRDGIGDACDNCPTVANCLNWGEGPGKTPVDVTNLQQVDYENPNCQESSRMNEMIGLACESLPGVGFGNDDDFDQDGISNFTDRCPRFPLANIVECDDESDCGIHEACSDTIDGRKICNHSDADGDRIGDLCDTCPFDQNADQLDDAAAQSGDADGDFVGDVCEIGQQCKVLQNARPYAFYEVAVNGYCCVTTFPGEGELIDGNEVGLFAPSTVDAQVRVPVRADCSQDDEDSGNCRRLPGSVLEEVGIALLPPGCEDALAAAGRCDPGDASCGEGDSIPNIELAVGNESAGVEPIRDPSTLWQAMCRLPQRDQDFDGVADNCDLCPFAFDPYNSPYKDPNTGKLWKDKGKFCNGEYDPDNLCVDEEDPGDTGDTGDSGDSGESDEMDGR